MHFKLRQQALAVTVVFTITNLLAAGFGGQKASAETAGATGTTVTFQQGASSYTGMTDTYLAGTKSTSGLNNSTVMEASACVQSGTNYGIREPLFKFSNIEGKFPEGAKVTSAYIDFYVIIQKYSSDAVVDAYQMTGSGIDINYATWSNKNSSEPWGDSLHPGPAPVAGIDYDSTPVTSFTVNKNALDSNGHMKVYLPAYLVDKWINDPAGNKGLLFKIRDSVYTECYIDFVSSYSSVTQINKPLLSVTYEIPPKFSLKVSNAGEKKMSLTLDNLNEAESAYQVWSYEEPAAEEGVQNAPYWRLIKKYSDGFETGISGGNASLYWDIKGNIDNNHKIFMRVKDSSGNIEQYTKEFSTGDMDMVKINDISIDGKTAADTVYKDTGSTAYISVNASGVTGSIDPVIYNYTLDDDRIGSIDSTEPALLYKIPADCAHGYHTLKVRTSQNGVRNGFDEVAVTLFVNNTTDVIPELTGDGLNIASEAFVDENVDMSLSEATGNGADKSCSIQIGEPGRGYNDTLPGASTSIKFNYPGVYQVFGSIRQRFAKSYSDGAIKYIRIKRTSGDAVTLNKDELLVTRNGESLTVFNSLVRNDTVQISTYKLKDNYMYSFWRLDAKGYRLIRDWTSGEGANTITWTPTQSGNYSIQVRVKDIAYKDVPASFEDAQTLAFEVQQYEQNCTGADITLTGINNSTELRKRSPVTIGVNAAADRPDNLLYRYEIYDTMMGTVTLHEYTPEAQCTWYPRKAGTYKVIVRIRDQASFGYYDYYITKDAEVI